LPDLNCREKELIESMKYSLEAGNKRNYGQYNYVDKKGKIRYNIEHIWLIILGK